MVSPVFASPHHISSTISYSPPPTLVLSAVMSRYLAFVFLALSASSVLAAPAEIPGLSTIPDAAAIPGTPLGARSNSKVYSPSTLHKRDWRYPGSTKDCHLSEEKSTALSYTHEGQEYSAECLSHLALSVPVENRKSCRNTGDDAVGYDEQCLFKKAFEEDWKFDMNKAKGDELAWRTVNTDRLSSDAWLIQFPVAISNCRVIPETMEKRVVDGKKKKGGQKEVKGATKTSDVTSGWNSYSVIGGETLDNECISRLFISAGVVIDLGICPVDETDIQVTDILGLTDILDLDLTDTLDLTATLDLAGILDLTDTIDLTALIALLFGRSTTELATPQDSAVVVSILAALSSGCLFDIVARIIAAVGIDALLLEGVLDLANGILTDLFDTA